MKTRTLPLTTGACAAAAAKAAVYTLFSGESVKQVDVQLPNGDAIKLPVSKSSSSKTSSTYFAIKPTNDDPDITKNIKIFATAQIVRSGEPGVRSKIQIRAGNGIGIITKPGLATLVGQPAINPVPLKMIKDEVAKVLPEGQGSTITISAPEGLKLAAKTFNERLGIVGGISILGTTGYVKPMSVDAFKSSLASQVDIALASGFTNVAITPGNIGQKAALNLGFAKESVIICSNHIGFILDKCAEKDIEKITLIGHLGKLLKILDGHFNTHSKAAKLNLGLLSPYLTTNKINKLNSAEEAIGLLSKDNLNQIASLVNKEIFKYIKKSVDGGRWTVDVNTYLINLQSEVVGASNV